MDMDSELIGPIQMGLNKPIHFTDFESSVRDIVNITAVAVIDAIVVKKESRQMKRQFFRFQNRLHPHFFGQALCYKY